MFTAKQVMESSLAEHRHDQEIAERRNKQDMSEPREVRRDIHSSWYYNLRHDLLALYSWMTLEYARLPFLF